MRALSTMIWICVRYKDITVVNGLASTGEQTKCSE